MALTRFYPTRLKLAVQSLKYVISHTLKNPGAVVSNPLTGITSIIAMFGGVLADQFGAGYVIVFVLALCTFVAGVWNESKKSKIYQSEAILLPIVINISNPANSINALNSLFNFIEKTEMYHEHQQNITKYLNIVTSDLIFNYQGDIFDKERLKDFLKITKHNLEKLKAHTPKNTTLYLAYIGPISIAVMIGTLFSTDGVRIFQYNKSSDSYYPVVEIKDRQLQENAQTFEKFEVQRPPSPTTDNVVVAIDAAGHKVNTNEPGLKAYGDLIHLRSKNQGTISQNEDWLQYCREIFSVLNEAQRTYREIKLVYSMPVALAIVLGMAFKNYWNIMLTNYDKTNNSYKTIIKTNEVTYYF